MQVSFTLFLGTRVLRWANRDFAFKIYVFFKFPAPHPVWDNFTPAATVCAERDTSGNEPYSFACSSIYAAFLMTLYLTLTTVSGNLRDACRIFVV